jgi:autotransporter-associated beta strand protein
VADATTFGSSSLPSGGLSITTGGLITGTPTTAGPLNVALSVSNAAGVTGSGNLLITVAAAPTSAPVITSSPSASGNVGVAFSYQITASNTPRSYAAANLPTGLNLNTATGLISGIPTTVGDTTVTLTAENPAGTSFSQDLAVSIGIAPPNIFTGSNPSLNTSQSWSLGTMPTASGNTGAFTDLVFSSSATDLTTSSGNVFGKSWNVTNGNGYKFSSVATNVTTFKIGNNNPVSTPFYNSVAGSNNVLVYLVNGSSLTFSPSNTTTATPSSLASLYNSGTLQIGSGSILRFQAPLGETGGSYSVTKVGLGTVSLEASNNYSGGTIVSEGVVNATVANSLSAGSITVNGGELNVSGENAWVGSKALTISGGRATFSASNNYTGVTTMAGGTLQLSNVAALGGSNTAGTFTLSGGTIEALVDYDLGHTWTTSTTVGSITFDKLDGKTTTVNGPVTLNATSGATLSLYKLAGNTNSSSVVTKTGEGTLKLMGGTPSGGWIGNWQINAGTLFVNTTSSGALGSNNVVVMNGGNLLFSKGVGSSGTYSGHGQDTALSVQAEATITLDPNPLTPAGANTVSFTNLNIGTQILHIAKGNSTKSSATDVGYTDPQLSFRAASLTGQATLDVAANVETVMQAGSGSGGVTKSGAGLLTLSDGTTVTTTVVDSLTNSVTNTIVSSYTGRTDINAGTLALRGSHSSAITIGSSAALQLALVSSSSPTTTQGLTLTGGSKVRPVGTPTEASYTLVTASGGITGTPVLETPIDGYELVKSNDNKSLILQQSLQDGFSQYLMAQNLLPGTAFDEVVNGSKVGLQYTFGSPTGVPQNNGAAAVPVMSGNQLTYTFDVKDDSALTLTYQTSTDLVTWTTWLADQATTITGPSPDRFLKKQLQFTGSGKLFIRINVTR